MRMLELVRGLTTLPPSLSRLSTQCGILNISQPCRPYSPPRPVKGIAFYHWTRDLSLSLIFIFRLQWSTLLIHITCLVNLTPFVAVTLILSQIMLRCTFACLLTNTSVRCVPISYADWVKTGHTHAPKWGYSFLWLLFVLTRLRTSSTYFSIELNKLYETWEFRE
jgi:hypothetical protein